MARWGWAGLIWPRPFVESSVFCDLPVLKRNPLHCQVTSHCFSAAPVSAGMRRNNKERPFWPSLKPSSSKKEQKKAAQQLGIHDLPDGLELYLLPIPFKSKCWYLSESGAVFRCYNTLAFESVSLRMLE